MVKLEGTIAVTDLPPHRGLIVSLCFFPVEAADAPAPCGGDPPAEAVTDCHEVARQVDFHAESSRAGCDLPFAVERPAITASRSGRFCFAPGRERCSRRQSSSSSLGGPFR